MRLIVQQTQCVLADVKPEAVIFDLGGVIVDIDTARTFNSLKRLTKRNALPSEFYELPLLIEFEKGKISSREFLTGLSTYLDCSYQEDVLIESWNSMIVDIPLERLTLIKKLRERLPVFAFSNTNSLHIEYVNKVLFTRHGYKSLASFFDMVFFSHELGERKPDVAAFDKVVKQADLEARRILFIDDNLKNVEGANMAGLLGWQINSPNEWIEYFREWK